MVSSYRILTTVSVPLEFIKLFNDYSNSFNSTLLDESIKTKSYYDTGYYPAGEKTLDSWLNGKLSKPEETLNFYTNNWGADEITGILFDKCEKFHGSIRVLSYMIENFFNIHDIKLNGIIIGINTDYPHLFFYEIVDNTINLNEPLTRKYTKDYEYLETFGSEDDDINTSDKMMYVIHSNMRKFYNF